MRKKSFFDGKKYVNVTLVKEGYDFVVYVDKVEYKRTPNELFAVQAFISI